MSEGIEAAVLARIAAELAKLDRDAAERVLTWARQKFVLNGSTERLNQAAIAELHSAFAVIDATLRGRSLDQLPSELAKLAQWRAERRELSR